jgi:hypothetical protein
MTTTALQGTTSVSITVALGIDTSSGVVVVSSILSNFGQDTVTANLLSVLVEDSLYYMGSNGHPWHHQVMRKMLPSAYGQAITLYPGMTVHDTEYVALDPVWVPENLRAVVFLQNLSTQQVYQTGFSEATFVQVSESSTPALPGRIVPVMNPKGVRFPGLAPGEVKQFQLFTADGRSVSARLQPSADATELTPVADQKGVYFYRITLRDGRKLTGRLVIF